MFIIKNKLLFIIKKSLTSLKIYVMIFNTTTKFNKNIALLKKNTHYLLQLRY